MDEESLCRDIEREIDSFSLQDFDTRWQPLRTRYEQAPFFKRLSDYAEARRKSLRHEEEFRTDDDAAGRRWLRENK